MSTPFSRRLVALETELKAQGLWGDEGVSSSLRQGVYLQGDSAGTVTLGTYPLTTGPQASAAAAVLAGWDWTEPAAGETVTALNTLAAITITPGMPVRIQTTGTGGTVDVRRSRALGDVATVRRHIGLAAESIAPAASGSVLVVGPLELTTAQWDAVTGETGGLVRGVEYYLDDLFGRLTRTPEDAAADVSVTNADGPYTGPRAVVPVGVALTQTVMLVRANWRGDEVAWHEGQANPHPQYAATTHTHALSDLTQSGATTGQVATWNGAAWVPQTPSGGGGGGSATYTAFVRDLGAARRSGTFDLTGLSGLTTGKVVAVVQTLAPIPSKGDAADEPEFDMIRLTGRVTSATTIRVTWQADAVVVGEYAFAYMVSA